MGRSMSRAGITTRVATRLPDAVVLPGVAVGLGRGVGVVPLVGFDVGRVAAVAPGEPDAATDGAVEGFDDDGAPDKPGDADGSPDGAAESDGAGDCCGTSDVIGLGRTSNEPEASGIGDGEELG